MYEVTVEFGYACEVSGRPCKWNFVLEMCVECLSCENGAQLPFRCERGSCLSIEIWLERQGNALDTGKFSVDVGSLTDQGISIWWAILVVTWHVELVWVLDHNHGNRRTASWRAASSHPMTYCSGQAKFYKMVQWTRICPCVWRWQLNNWTGCV